MVKNNAAKVCSGSQHTRHVELKTSGEGIMSAKQAHSALDQGKYKKGYVGGVDILRRRNTGGDQKDVHVDQREKGKTHAARFGMPGGRGVSGAGKRGSVGEKQARKEEREALLEEAKKSKKDLFTGCYHCLSCGKGFEDVGALADHLRKHNGVNSDDYKVLQYGQHRAQNKPAPRASKTGFLFGDLMEVVAKSAVNNGGQKRSTASGFVVSTMVNHQHQKVKVKVKKEERKPERISEEERMRLESALKGLRLKRTQRIAVRKPKSVSVVKRRVLVEHVVSAQKLVAEMKEKLGEHTAKMTDESLPLDGPEALAMEAKRAVEKSEEQLRTAVAKMRQKLTARQHLAGLLFASLRHEPLASCEDDLAEIDVEEEAFVEDLALFEELEEHYFKSDEDSSPVGSSDHGSNPQVATDGKYCADGELVDNSGTGDKASDGSLLHETCKDTTPSELSRNFEQSDAHEGLPCQVDGADGEISHEVDFVHLDSGGSAYESDSSSSGSDFFETNALAAWAKASGCGGFNFASFGKGGGSASRTKTDDTELNEGAKGLDSEQPSFKEELNGEYKVDSLPKCVAASKPSENQAMVLRVGDRKRAENSSQATNSGLGSSLNEDKESQGTGRDLEWVGKSSRQSGSHHEQVPSQVSTLSAELPIGGTISAGYGDQTAIESNMKGKGETLPKKAQPVMVRSYASVVAAKMNDASPPEVSSVMQEGQKAKRKKKKKKAANRNPVDGSEGSSPEKFICEICNRHCSTLADYEEHLKGKTHTKRSLQRELEAGLMESGGYKVKNMLGPTVMEVNESVVALLKRLNELQHNSMVRHKDNKSKVHKWLMNGANEVLRAVKRGKMKALFVAPDIEEPLSDQLVRIIEEAKSQQVFAIYALSRKNLGSIYQVRKKMTVVGVLDSNGADPLLKHLVNVVEKHPEVKV